MRSVEGVSPAEAREPGIVTVRRDPLGPRLAGPRGALGGLRASTGVSPIDAQTETCLEKSWPVPDTEMVLFGHASDEAGAMMIDERRRKALTAGFILRWNSRLSCGIRYAAMELLAGVCDPGPSSLSMHS